MNLVDGVYQRPCDSSNREVRCSLLLGGNRERGGVWHLSVAFLTAADEFTVISKSKVEKRYQTLGLELEFQLYFNSDHNY